MARLENCHRTEPPVAAGEREMLTAFLDWQRATVLCKLAGLSDEELRRPHQPSGLTLLGIVKHLAAVEMSWFRFDFAAEDPAAVSDLQPYESYWTILPDESTADILNLYRREVERSRAIVVAASLDDVARGPDVDIPNLTLRWIILHMIEETARHLGHLDLIREAIDGQTGH
jgi:uncharacterized damage-inducible protein DinB